MSVMYEALGQDYCIYNSHEAISCRVLVSQPGKSFPSQKASELDTAGGKELSNMLITAFFSYLCTSI